MFRWSWLLIAGLFTVACGPVDEDGDGFSVEDGDCNDLSALIGPSIPELCDGVDQNCDGIVDNDALDEVLFYRDNDRDTYGDDKVTQSACTVPDGFVVRGGDCDDANPDANPEGVDTADADQDCDGKIDSPKKPKYFDGPITIDDVEVTCEGDQLVFRVTTTGVTDGGMVFFQETANVEPQWSEEHDLDSVKADPYGFFDNLEQSLTESVAFADQARNVGTLFPCGWFGKDLMTMVIAVTDDTGAIAACVVDGDDPRGLIDESYERINDPSFSLSSCVISAR